VATLGRRGTHAVAVSFALRPVYAAHPEIERRHCENLRDHSVGFQRPDGVRILRALGICILLVAPLPGPENPICQKNPVAWVVLL